MSKYRAKNSPAFLTVVEIVADRRSIQRGMLKAGLVDFDMSSPIVSDHRKCRRLMQSLGVIADQLESIEDKDNHDARMALRDAVLYLTANGFAWLEAIEGGLPRAARQSTARSASRSTREKEAAK